MIVKHDEQLSKYTTIKIGGIAKNLYFPENVEELIGCINFYSSQHVIGGGSNLLINDKKVFDHVISMSKVDRSIENHENGHFTVGASVRLQELIKVINQSGFGGIEYLFSVPGMVGGAVAMNAGRGRSFNQCISDYIESVTFIEDGAIRKITKDQCDFSYRNSRFKLENEIIISTDFVFPKVEIETSQRLVHDRINHCKNVQDNSKPNFGTVFSQANGTIMKWVSLMGLGWKVGFSRKTKNWLLKKSSTGSYSDAIRVIRIVEVLHEIMHKHIAREFVEWI